MNTNGVSWKLWGTKKGIEKGRLLLCQGENDTKQIQLKLSEVEVKAISYPCNRPWSFTGMWDVEAPTFSR
jgi:hypothetical protein